MANLEDLTGLSDPLYEARKGVYPKAVDGFFRRFKWAIMAVTLAIYYVTPWIRWDRIQLVNIPLGLFERLF